jgi:hypothetical protein
MGIVEDCRLPIEVIVDCRLSIADLVFAQKLPTANSFQSAIGNRQ